VSDPFALLYRARDRMHATLLQHALEYVDIPVQLAGGVAGELDGVFGNELKLTEIWVPREHLELGRKVIETVLESEAEQGSPAEGPAWACASCGEDNDSGFTICWNCQSLRK